jgi:hypothetical protein
LSLLARKVLSQIRDQRSEIRIQISLSQLPISRSPRKPDAPDPAASRKAERIDRDAPWAWRGADYLRSKLLEAEPDHKIGKRPWGDEIRTGHRLAWADAIRLMIEQDKRPARELRPAIDWLFSGDRRYKPVVESGDTLRSKWDAISRARQREATPPPADRTRAAELPAAFVDAPKRKEWTR